MTESSSGRKGLTLQAIRMACCWEAEEDEVGALNEEADEVREGANAIFEPCCSVDDLRHESPQVNTRERAGGDPGGRRGADQVGSNERNVSRRNQSRPLNHSSALFPWTFPVVQIR